MTKVRGRGDACARDGLIAARWLLIH
jgi:hypothetical protein